LALVGTEVQAFGAHELDVVDADEPEYVPEVGFLEIDRRGRALALDAAAG
jgi:hypothetical protein